jgi:hypothetical protein|tara:strand:+ start:15047 stop:15454 length:408 start_codon:yes stop_codon:yes gene_type:complete
MKIQNKVLEEPHKILDGEPTSPTEILGLCKTNPGLESAFLACSVRSKKLKPASIGEILKGCRDIEEYSFISTYDYRSSKRPHTILKKGASSPSGKNPPVSNPTSDLQSKLDYYLYRDREVAGIASERKRIADILN